MKTKKESTLNSMRGSLSLDYLRGIKTIKPGPRKLNRRNLVEQALGLHDEPEC
jgi:hypothetical protein